MEKSRKILWGILFGILLSLFSATPTVLAYEHQADADALARTLGCMEGDWYAPGDDLVLSIHDGEINGCPVIAGFDFFGAIDVGEGYFRISDQDETYDIKLEWDTRSRVVKYIKMEDGTRLHKI